MTHLLDNGIISDLDSESENESDNESINSENLVIDNPFFKKTKVVIGDNFKEINEYDINDIYKNFSNLYVICRKNNSYNIDTFYKKKLTVSELKDNIKKLSIFKTNLKLIKNSVHKSLLVIVDNYYLKYFINDLNYVFNDKELVLLLINIDQHTFLNYENIYYEKNSIRQYFIAKTVCKFYQQTSGNIDYLIRLIKDSTETKYWCYPSNLKLSITNKFKIRQFYLSKNNRIKNKLLKNILDRIDGNDNKRNNDNQDYFDFDFDDKTYVDPSVNKDYTSFKIYDEKEIDSNIVNSTLENIDTEFELYNLSLNLLISKNLCHLVLNNSLFLQKLENFRQKDILSNVINRYSVINKYLPIYQFAIGYSWLTFYIEECIKKSYITKEDRFVFDINTASMLPSFPFVTLNDGYRYNPYFTLLVSDEEINLPKNLLGVEYNNNETYGVVRLYKFKENFNIFMTSNKSLNFLENVDMSNLAIGGSMIPACITKYNPLMRLFDDFDRYCKEYYATSDLDIMCNIQNTIEYIDRIHLFHNQISKNCLELFNDNVLLKPIKSAILIVNEKFIIDNIVNDKYSYKFIIQNISEIKVKMMFYKFYIKHKTKDNKEYFDNDIWRNEKYNIYFEILNIDSINIILTNNNQESICKYSESIKFEILCNSLNHKLEIFKTKYSGDFFSVVSRFHLPCVRGYYDGTNVYLLPSCITAAMTLTNIDYKYFAGTNNPIEIILKYLQRGYGTILNSQEITKTIKYCYDVIKWRTSFNNFNYKSKLSVNRNILGDKSPNNDFFKPRKILHNQFEHISPVRFDYIKQNSISLSEISYISEFNKYCFDKKWSNLSELLNVSNFKTISSYGNVNIINNSKWNFDLIYINKI